MSYLLCNQFWSLKLEFSYILLCNGQKVEICKIYGLPYSIIVS